jgi:hypothetical protein
MTCENITLKGDGGTPITAYVARPEGAGPFPGVVLIHHLPGWSEYYIETTRRFAHHGYIAICANLYERAGAGNPDDVAAKVRAEGGIPDAQMVGDTAAAVAWMRAQPELNGKVGLADLAALVAERCRRVGFTAYDVSALVGVVTGYLRDRPMSPRAEIEALASAYSFDAVETDGEIRFVPRGRSSVATLTLPELAVPDQGEEITLMTTAAYPNFRSAILVLAELMKAAGMKVKVVYDGPIKAPIAAGQHIADLVVETPSTPPQVMPLVAENAVGKAGVFRRAWAGFLSFFGA